MAIKSKSKVLVFIRAAIICGVIFGLIGPLIFLVDMGRKHKDTDCGYGS